MEHEPTVATIRTKHTLQYRRRAWSLLLLDTVRFCYIARGSLEETLSHIILAHELNYIPDILYNTIRQEGDELFRVLNGYIAYLKRSKQGGNAPDLEKALRESGDFYLTEQDSE